MEYVEKIASIGLSLTWKDGVLYSSVSEMYGGGTHMEYYEDTHNGRAKALLDSIEHWFWLLSE